MASPGTRGLEGPVIAPSLRGTHSWDFVGYLRKAVGLARRPTARVERREALGLAALVPNDPIFDVPNATQEQKDQAIRTELERKPDGLGQSQLPHVLSGALLPD